MSPSWTNEIEQRRHLERALVLSCRADSGLTAIGQSLEVAIRRRLMHLGGHALQDSPDAWLRLRRLLRRASPERIGAAANQTLPTSQLNTSQPWHPHLRSTNHRAPFDTIRARSPRHKDSHELLQFEPILSPPTTDRSTYHCGSHDDISRVHDCRMFPAERKFTSVNRPKPAWTRADQSHDWRQPRRDVSGSIFGAGKWLFRAARGFT